MALMKSLLFLNFDKTDSEQSKNNLRKLAEGQGSKIIHEIKDENNRVIEWIFMGQIQRGKFENKKPSGIVTNMDKRFVFDPKGSKQ